jgi:predicted nucleic acid-binding protein
MNALIDSNVLLDVFLNRPPFVREAVELLVRAEHDFRAYVSASAVTDIYYIARKAIKDSGIVQSMLRNLLDVVQVAGVSKRDIFAALDSGCPDFEDAVQNAVAETHEFDAIVTRDPAGFAASSLPVYTPRDFLAQFSLPAP